MNVTIQIDGDIELEFDIDSPAVPRIGDTMRIKIPGKPVGADVAHVKVECVHWNFLDLPTVTARVYGETYQESSKPGK